MNINSNEPILEFPFPKSEFLDTAFRVKMNGPIGEVTYLEMEVQNTSGDSEDPGMGQILLRPMRKVVESQTYEVKSNVSKDHVDELEKMGIDTNHQMFSVLDNESFMMMQKQLQNKYHELGDASYEKILSKWKKFLRKYLGIEHVLYVESDQLITKMLVLSNMIAVKTRRGPANFAIVSPMINSILADDPRFAFSEMNSLTKGGEIYSSGRVGHSIKVFVDPNMSFDNMKILLGRTTEHGNTGIVMGEYSRQAMKVDDYGAMDFSTETKYMIRDRYVINTVGSNPEDSFVSVEIKLGKKPFWKKLIGA
jgi:hypothetical protein